MNNSITKNFSLKEVLGNLSDYYELTKPGITLTVVSSMMIGFLMGSAGSVNFVNMIHAIVGTYLIAAGTAAHNMFLERDLDGIMKRTSKRPIPANRLEPWQGLFFSMGLILFGLVYLLFMVNIVAGMVSLATTVIYLYAYTPLKRISALNVFVGAIPGALPVVGGWAAATGTVFEHGMWILFGVVYCWQIPHVMAIAWVCKDDYEHAGFKMLPKNDPHGLKASLWIIVPLLILIPTVYKLYVMELVSWLYLGGSLLTTLGYLYYGIRFIISRDKAAAKSLMLASFVYLPLIWIFIFTDWMIL
ncbi:heme o synthase [Rhodohalobacter sp. 614A]|uniref:heme o synthase n=1 Tax=Rhodohalobacter sp. 614A TaxID=2908649 RepID=UPI001F44C6C2|nr:heme o synthase [Rhodohalobacter sp. 614A]